jgi:hypothetical protein
MRAPYDGALHETGALEHLDVLRRGRERDGERFAELPHSVAQRDEAVREGARVEQARGRVANRRRTAACRRRPRPARRSRGPRRRGRPRSRVQRGPARRRPRPVRREPRARGPPPDRTSARCACARSAARRASSSRRPSRCRATPRPLALDVAEARHLVRGLPEQHRLVHPPPVQVRPDRRADLVREGVHLLASAPPSRSRHRRPPRSHRATRASSRSAWPSTCRLDPLREPSGLGVVARDDEAGTEQGSRPPPHDLQHRPASGPAACVPAAQPHPLDIAQGDHDGNAREETVEEERRAIDPVLACAARQQTITCVAAPPPFADLGSEVVPAPRLGSAHGRRHRGASLPDRRDATLTRPDRRAAPLREPSSWP